MKVSKNVSIDLELLNRVRTKEESFSRAVAEALEIWLESERFFDIFYRSVVEFMVPPEKIWPMLLLDKTQEWMNMVHSSEYTSEKREGVGTTGRLIAEAVGVKAEWEIQYTEYIENEKLSWRTTGGNITALTSITLKPKGNQTEMKIVFCGRLGEAIPKKIAKEYIEMGMKRGLEKLKKILEEQVG